MQKFYLIGEKDNNRQPVDMKKIFESINVKPEVIFTEGTGKSVLFRTYNPFHDYLRERESMKLPVYEYITKVLGSNKNKLQSNVFSVEDTGFMNFENCLLNCVYLYSKRRFNALKTLDKNGLEEINYELITLCEINNKILEDSNYDYTQNEKKIAEISKRLINVVLRDFETICVPKNYDAFKTANLHIIKMYKEKELEIYRDIRNDIFYENIINNLREEQNVVIFLGDAHMPFFINKFPNHLYTTV